MEDEQQIINLNVKLDKWRAEDLQRIKKHRIEYIGLVMWGLTLATISIAYAKAYLIPPDLIFSIIAGAFFVLGWIQYFRASKIKIEKGDRLMADENDELKQVLKNLSAQIALLVIEIRKLVKVLEKKE